MERLQRKQHKEGVTLVRLAARFQRVGPRPYRSRIAELCHFKAHLSGILSSIFPATIWSQLQSPGVPVILHHLDIPSGFALNLLRRTHPE